MHTTNEAASDPPQNELSIGQPTQTILAAKTDIPKKYHPMAMLANASPQVSASRKDFEKGTYNQRSRNVQSSRHMMALSLDSALRAAA